MKVRVLFSVILSALLIAPFACDDEVKTASIEGEWKGTRAEGEVLVYGVPSGFEEVDDTFSPNLVFQPNGRVTLTNNGMSASGKWSQDGGTLTTPLNFKTNFVDVSGSYAIHTLTESRLALYYEKDGIYVDPDTGIQIEGTLKATLFFEKQ
jgi:hypothetical protein